MGLALVRKWKDGYFRLEGFGPSGTISDAASETATTQKASTEGDSFNPGSVEDARIWI
jgi:hypothetical protein